MSNFTLNFVLDSIRSDVEDVLRNVSDYDLRDMTAEDVCNLLDENSYYAPEVIYYADGWEIVAGSSFNEYEPIDTLDFSGCEDALDCIMLEARMIMDSVYYNEREAIAHEVLEGLQEDLPDESDDNFVVEYLENGNTEYVYFFADNEEHAIEQFNDFFKDYEGDIKLVHCGYIVG